jgi:predicted ester cyclase
MLKVRATLSFLIPAIALVVSLGFMAGCEKAKTEKNKAMVHSLLDDAYNQGNLDIIDEVCAADYTWPMDNPQVHSSEEMKEHVAVVRTNFPDIHITAEDMIAEGNKVVTRWTIVGTHKGELLGIPPTNVQVTFTGILFGFIADSKIAGDWENFDALGLMQQLGVMPPMPGGPPAMQRAAPEDFAWSAPSDVTGDPGDPEANKALVLREFEAWNQKNLDTLMTVLDEIYAAEFVYHDPPRPHVTDLASYKKWAAEECIVPFPDLSMPVEDIIAEGNKVAVRWVFTGTSKALGKQVTQTGISIYRIADRRIVEAWCACDMLGAIQQMGVIPPMGQSEE